MDGNAPAFPARLEQQRDPAGVYTDITTYPGMTYRQWLVGMALQGLLANQWITESFVAVVLEKKDRTDIFAEVGSEAVAFADAVIRAQEK